MRKDINNHENNCSDLKNEDSSFSLPGNEFSKNKKITRAIRIKDKCKTCPRSLNAFPLCAVEPGRKVTVSRISGGRGVISKLSALGILPGAEIEVAGNLGGPMIVIAKGARISLGQNLSHKIMVE
jgi:ferrous iron transport protein A